MWSYEVIWQIKNIDQGGNIPQRAPTHKFPWYFNYVRLMRLHDKLNTLYIHLQKIYGHHTREGIDLPWEAYTIKVTLHFYQVTNVRSSNKLIKIYPHIAKSVATILGRVVTLGRRFRPQELFLLLFFFVRAKSFNVRFCSSSNVYSLWGILVVLLCDIKVASFRMIC